MPEYYITSSRHDVPTRTIHTFTADDDAKARKVFAEYTAKENYSWDDLDLVLIIKPAVAEESKTISRAERQGRAGENIVHLT